jgi:anti-anti-sigma regulatory factor
MEAGGALVLALHGSFDGASAWALRVELDERGGPDVVVDLTHAEEACEFAACVLAAYAREHRRTCRVRCRAATPALARLLSAYGLELCDSDSPTGEAA